MKIDTRRKNIKIPIIIIVLCAIVGILALLIVVNKTTNSSPTTTQEPRSTVDYKNASEDQVSAGDAAKGDFSKRDSEASLERQEANGTPSEQKSDTAVVISSTTINSGIVSIRSILQTIDSSGTCSVSLTKASKILSRSSGTQSMGSYSTCSGFDINTSDLSSGEWEIQLNYKGSSGQAGTAKGMLSIP